MTQKVNNCATKSNQLIQSVLDYYNNIIFDAPRDRHAKPEGTALLAY